MLGLGWFVIVVMVVWYAGRTADTAQRKRDGDN